MVILFADDLVCVFVLFVVWMRPPAMHAAGIVYRPLWEFSLTLPRVRSFLAV